MTTDAVPQHAKRVAVFIVPGRLVKRVKTSLEQQNKIEHTCKIRPWSTDDGGKGVGKYAGRFVIVSSFNHDSGEAVKFLRDECILGDVDIIGKEVSAQDDTSSSQLELATRNWYHGMNLQACGGISLHELLRELPKTYSIYGPLLLLPQHAFQSDIWKRLFQSIKREQLLVFFREMSKLLKVSHIAANAPIPLHGQGSENIVRSPTNLTPLYGDFGPVCTAVSPSKSDFDAAFWCHTKQNGITQVWAPRYTMFSRGNITEKARVLNLPSVATAIAQTPDTGCAAVDLYTGIGYFTFSYLTAGVTMVLGWDINPWSIEGLRRGAVANKWAVQIHSTNRKTDEISLGDDTRLVAFLESNERALARIETMRPLLPPIRHVNCGLLPSSKGSYATAVAALDPRLGGWVHVHENFALAVIEENSARVRDVFEQLVRDLDGKRGLSASMRAPVLLEHVQRVKSYAPGVFHCVVDVFIPPISP